jgi:hypothetical protein
MRGWIKHRHSGEPHFMCSLGEHQAKLATANDTDARRSDNFCVLFLSHIS